jgi:proteasome accessory factor B
VSRKSERLVNLVIALLATKRNLTKSEIFRIIEGYEGSLESMDRMFERDKDELRSLGIEIEVAGLDPLFYDEMGYTIRPENFEMDLDAYSSTEISFMSLAAQLWKDAALGDISRKTLRKLSTSNAAIDISVLPNFAPLIQRAPSFLTEILTSITERRSIEFSYIDTELNTHVRKVNVYSYFSMKGFWYFSGLDIAKDAIRTFRCDRIHGEIEVSKKSLSYEIPQDFKADVTFKEEGLKRIAELRVRKGRGSQLRNLATRTTPGVDEDIIEIEYVSEFELMDLVLWHLDDVEVIAPKDLRANVMQILKNLVKAHE